MTCLILSESMAGAFHGNNLTVRINEASEGEEGDVS
jgi:hypothetical protein